MSRWLQLHRTGVQVVLDVGGPQLPRLVYWGDDLGDLDDAAAGALPGAAYTPSDEHTHEGQVPLTLSPTRAQGWSGWPGLTGHRGGLATQPLFTLDAVDELADGLSYTGVDIAAALRLDGELVLTDQGVLKCRQTLTSTATDAESPYVVEDLLTLLPVPEQVTDLLDHAGRWANEAQPQRQQLAQGSWLREQRRGRTGPDSPLLLALGTPGFGYRHGQVWGVHLGWSGDQRYLAQRLNTGQALLGAGEILAAGEVILGAGESMTTPWVYGVYSGEGLDGASARLHAMLRARPSHPRGVRPVVLNSWEAVYFEHSYDRLAALARAAADVGVERFVIDDGWFGGRRDDRRGLGDWYVSGQVWPDGLAPIVDLVKGLGMQFGLWVEPEMVNLDSELARAHPDWVLGTAGRMPPPWRSQQVLDVSHPGAFDYLLERLDSLVGEYGVDYLKWDHNRDLADPVHRAGPRAGRPAVRDQTLAAYRLMDELRARHPKLEIESCSSGGARVDYGVLERADRVWASDCIDPIERARIVPALATLLPFELIGAHVASDRSHTTARRHDLGLRLAIATFGHSGFEWDLSALSDAERADLAHWVAFVKDVRGLVHSGTLVRLERPADPGTVLFGVVAADRDEALFAFVRTHTNARYGSAPLLLDGLDPHARYRVERVTLPGEIEPMRGVGFSDGVRHAELTGAQLMHAGVVAPSLRPEQAALYRLSAVAH